MIINLKLVNFLCIFPRQIRYKLQILDMRDTELVFYRFSNLFTR